MANQLYVRPHDLHSRTEQCADGNCVAVYVDADVAALQKRCERLTAALDEALEYFEDREDVVDGPYGEPSPNNEMRIAMVLRTATGETP